MTLPSSDHPPDPHRPGKSGLPVGSTPTMRTSAQADTNDLARGAGVNYLGYVARIAPRALFLVLAGRLYGEAHFGAYTFGITVVETVAVVGLFGLRKSLFKFMSEELAEEGKVYRALTHGIVFAMTLAILLATVTAASAPFIAGLFSLPEAARPLMVFSLAIPMIVLSDILLTGIRFTRQMRFEVYARSLAEPITLTLAVVIVYLAGVEALGLAVAYTASLTVAAGVTLFFFVRIYSVRECLRVRLEWTEFRELAGFSVPTAASEVLTMVQTKVDIFLVAFFLPAPVVGIYGMARQFSTVTRKIRAGFDRILPPILSESLAVGNLERAERQISVVARWILTVQLLLLLFFVFFGENVLGVVDGAFAAGALILIFLMIGDAVEGSLGISDLPFVYLRPVMTMVFGAALLVIGTLSNIWLIQWMGAEGAALAVLLTVSLVNGARILANRWMFGLRVVDWNLFKPVIAALPAAAVMLGVESMLPDSTLFQLLLGIPALLATYGLALALLGLEPEDHQQVQRIVSRFRR